MPVTGEWTNRDRDGMTDSSGHERYVYAGTITAGTRSLEVVRCVRCGALILNGTTSQGAHDTFHMFIETAASAADGYNLDGTRRNR